MKSVTRMVLTAPLSLLGGSAAAAAVFLANPGGLLLAENGTPACRLVSILSATAAGAIAFAGTSWLLGWFGPVRRGVIGVVGLVGLVAVGLAVGYLWLWGWPVVGHLVGE
ncbi:hypothetical protein Afil01_24150 [Actinorhabdospora filicis]|uniref:Major facilitator superfamily (MFS) profile domain-containing protein n=1 Tax=Actinorhabdospora filicis TaxID=1785913 RepID=A0A9W6SKE7_9ACTN|nr:hypothetical protein [Actinorhabdospora filicis]GLZ77608.1 hypothetical protein Afil01_24150 [Actinorhabdospora filicis]